jgi:hypothetical protein
VAPEAQKVREGFPAGNRLQPNLLNPESALAISWHDHVIDKGSITRKLTVEYHSLLPLSVFMEFKNN